MTTAAVAREALEARQRRAEPGLVEETGTIPVDGRDLFFHLWRPDGPAGRTGVSIAHSFVDHALLQRAEATFARAAARSGFAAILVQAPGAGDSAGEPEDCRVAGRVGAVVAGFEELRRRAPGVERPCFLGAALGGLIAARAAAGRDDAALALWQPNLDGDAYWTEIRRMLRLARVREARGEIVPGRDGADVMPEHDPDSVLGRDGIAELLGMRVTAAQLEELRRTGAGLGAGSIAGPALVVTAAGYDETPNVRRIVRGDVEAAAAPGRRAVWHLGRPGGTDVIGPTIDWLRRLG